MIDADVFGRLSKKYGEGFHLRKPAGAKDYYSSQTIELFPADIVTGNNYDLCQATVKPRNSLILHNYGARAEILVPSGDFVGFVYIQLTPEHLMNKMAWTLVRANVDALDSRSNASDGIPAISGVSSFTPIAVGQGGQAIYGFSGEAFRLRVRVVDQLGGGDISPEGMRLTAFTSGYLLDY